MVSNITNNTNKNNMCFIQVYKKWPIYTYLRILLIKANKNAKSLPLVSRL